MLSTDNRSVAQVQLVAYRLRHCDLAQDLVAGKLLCVVDTQYHGIRKQNDTD